nr:NADH dehydrogenase subunit 3 [Nelidina sp. n.]
MSLMLTLTMIIILIMSMIMLIILLVSKKKIIDMQKSTPFECGFNPMSYARIPFSIHFFLIAVIFLIFDIEIIMIMPIIMSMKTSMLFYWMISSLALMLILLIGLIHEWKMGMIKWTI